VDGTLLALAGLERLELHDLIARSQAVPAGVMLPAVAQGAIGIQCREEDDRVLSYLRRLNDADTKACVDCERAFLRGLDGNCRTPIAGQASLQAGVLRFKGFLSKADGSESVFVERSGDARDCDGVGEAAAQEIKQHLGAAKFREYQLSFDEAI
jgi:hydroxymethylbilane synthase